MNIIQNRPEFRYFTTPWFYAFPQHIRKLGFWSEVRTCTRGENLSYPLRLNRIAHSSRIKWQLVNVYFLGVCLLCVILLQFCKPDVKSIYKVATHFRAPFSILDEHECVSFWRCMHLSCCCCMLLFFIIQSLFEHTSKDSLLRKESYINSAQIISNII